MRWYTPPTCIWHAIWPRVVPLGEGSPLVDICRALPSTTRAYHHSFVPTVDTVLYPHNPENATATQGREKMVLLGFRRGRSSRISRLYWPFVALSLGVLFSVLEVFSVQSSLARVSREPPGDFAKQRIFIASIHWNNEKILRDYWISAVLALAKELGPENVFVSIQESGSWDDSKGALRLLNHSLAEIGVPSKIVLDKTTHLDEISKVPDAKGWIETPRGKTELRRIPYLARLRNQVLQPLYEAQNTARRFDKILFLNDVVFRVSKAFWPDFLVGFVDEVQTEFRHPRASFHERWRLRRSLRPGLLETTSFL